MSYHFRPGKREGVQLLIGIAGPSASGKTLSALKLAAGLSEGKPFAYVDTESGRALHYADDFDFLHTELDEPFSPGRYREVLAEAAKTNPPVIVIDSMTHEHAGPGGVLAMHEAELDRRAGDDFKKREALKMSAWIKPKQERKLLIGDLLRVRCHLILCFRAEEKVDIVRDEKGKTQVIPKRTVAGHVGWIPVCGKEYPYELTLSLVMTPDRPGMPQPIKIMDQHRPLVPLDEPLSEKTGQRLAAWARGGTSTTSGMSKGDFSAKIRAAGISQDRVREVGKSLYPDKASLNALTNDERAELWAALETDSGSEVGGTGPDDEAGETEAGVQPQPMQTDGSASAASDFDGPEPGAFQPPAGVRTDDPDVVAANEAGHVRFTSGKWSGKSLAQVAEEEEGYIEFVLGPRWKTESMKRAALAYSRIYLPHLYEAATAQQEIHA